MPGPHTKIIAIEIGRSVEALVNSAPFQKRVVMVSGAYLRQQAEILIAMSRATLDLGIAGRLRQMASELQARAAEQENECGFADNEVASFKRPVRMGS
jgi:hypothetical protein